MARRTARELAFRTLFQAERGGAPLADVALTLGAQTAVSDGSGVAAISLSTSPAHLLVGRRGEDVGNVLGADFFGLGWFVSHGVGAALA